MMRAILGILGALALAACQLPMQKSITLGASSSSSSPPATVPDRASSGGSTSVGPPSAEWQAQQGQSHLDASNFLRAEFESLKGLPVADARARAKARGHTGEVKVEQVHDFIEGCKDGIVCYASDERGGQSGMGNDETLVLHINKTLSIAAPPPN